MFCAICQSCGPTHDACQTQILMGSRQLGGQVAPSCRLPALLLTAVATAATTVVALALALAPALALAFTNTVTATATTLTVYSSFSHLDSYVGCLHSYAGLILKWFEAIPGGPGERQEKGKRPQEGVQRLGVVPP